MFRIQTYKLLTRFLILIPLALILAACGGGGGGSSSSTSPTTAPAAPSGLSAIATSESSISLSWTDNSIDETDFVVLRGATSDGAFSTLVLLSANTASYIDSGLPASTTYYYRVYANNSAGSSSDSNQTSATTNAPPSIPPTAPNSLSATATSSSSISLSWTDNSNDEESFVVQRWNGSVFSTIATLGSNITSYINSGLSASTTYYYRVYATNSAGASSVSNQASATTNSPPATPPNAPSGLSATATSSSSISLSWTDNSNNETSFVVQRRLGSTYFNIATLGSNITSYIDSGLSASTTYYYRVYAANSAGSSSYSNQANATTYSPTVTPPNAPSGLSATATSSSSISLSWTDNSNDETSFVVQRWNGSVFSTIATLGSNITSYINSSLSASTTYYYRVYASNSAGSSSYSNQASATTSGSVTTSTLKITNNLSGTGSNRVLQLRVAPTVSGSRSDTNEILSPDGQCIYLGPEDIAPGEATTYNVSSSLAASGYNVFIGLGIWDNSFCSSSYWAKKMWSTDANFNIFYIYQIASIPASLTDGRDVELRLAYNGNYLWIYVFSDGVSVGDFGFSVQYSDPTTP